MCIDDVLYFGCRAWHYGGTLSRVQEIRRGDFCEVDRRQKRNESGCQISKVKTRSVAATERGLTRTRMN